MTGADLEQPERPRFTYRVKGRYWRFRRGKLNIALPGEPGHENFESAYLDALSRAELHNQFVEMLDEQVATARQQRAGRARARRIKKPGRASDGFIYFIGGHSGPVKIGFTTDLPARLRRLQMNSPRPLRVLAFRPGEPRDELALHRQFAADRLHGEWFKRTPAVLETLREWLA